MSGVGSRASATSWTSATCQANGTSVHYLRSGGPKPPVVMLHGLTGSGACWLPVARTLARRFDVILPDARGHGGSSAEASAYVYDELARDVEGLVEALGLVRPVVMGHSMGGLTAALVAARRRGSGGVGELGALVLVDPTFLSPERQREVYESDVAARHARSLASSRNEQVEEARSRHPERSLELHELQVDAWRKTHPGAFDVLIPPSPDYRALVAAIDTPTLLVVGTRTVVTHETADGLAAANPRLRVEVVEGAGHGLPFDFPDRLADLVGSFLGGLDRVG